VTCSPSTSPRVLNPVPVWPLFNFYFDIMACSPATTHWWRHAPQPWTCKYLQNNDYVASQPNGTSKYASKQCQCGSFLSFFCCKKFTLIWQADVFFCPGVHFLLICLSTMSLCIFPKVHSPNINGSLFTIYYLEKLSLSDVGINFFAPHKDSINPLLKKVHIFIAWSSPKFLYKLASNYPPRSFLY
jgi:hypothetical protein